MTEGDPKSKAEVMGASVVKAAAAAADRAATAGADKAAAAGADKAAAAIGAGNAKTAIDVVADAGAVEATAKISRPINPATTRQKILMLIVLVLMTLFMLWLGKWAVSTLDGYVQRQNEVYWQSSPAITLKPGPVTFWHDATKNRLVHIGVIDEKKKSELIGLAATGEQPAPAELKGYWAAIDQLAFVSNQNLGGFLIGLLVLGGLAGSLGAQLRSLINFVGQACYTGQLDIVIWWPYYALRPFTGFLLGTVIVIVVQAGLFAAGTGGPSGTLWWASIAFLAGFGDQDFTQRLRQLTKTLFGESK